MESTLPQNNPPAVNTTATTPLSPLPIKRDNTVLFSFLAVTIGALVGLVGIGIFIASTNKKQDTKTTTKSVLVVPTATTMPVKPTPPSEQARDLSQDDAVKTLDADLNDTDQELKTLSDSLNDTSVDLGL